MKRKTAVYALVDPISKEVRYVGISVNPPGRLGNHIRDAQLDQGCNPALSAWMRRLLSAGLEPEMVILQETTKAIAQVQERRWYAYFEEQGCRLLNLTNLSRRRFQVSIRLPIETALRFDRIDDHEAFVQTLVMKALG